MSYTDPYDELSDNARECILFVENTEPLYMDLMTIARMINQRPKAFGPPTVRSYTHSLSDIISEARRLYRADVGEPLKLPAKDRAQVKAFLLELAKEYAADLKRTPEGA